MPEKLPKSPKVIWRHPLTAQGLGGVAATTKFVLVGDRDALDSQDLFRCLNAETGDEIWKLPIVSSGRLDYGSSSRATPLIHGEFAYFYNAFGDLYCVKLATGEPVWNKNLLKDFGGYDSSNAWGTSSSPLIVDDKLIVNPGGAEASVAALDPATGKVIWQTPGGRAAFASFIVGTFGNKKQIVGYEKNALIGLDASSGHRLWRLVPPSPNDFNVPTPIDVAGRLLVATENNGTRLYEFDNAGIIKPEPVARNFEMAPDTHTPIVLGDRLFGVWLGMQCLDIPAGLQSIWLQEEEAFDDYAVLVGHGNRVLAISKFGELILMDAAANTFQPISRVFAFEDDPGVFSHPAFVGTRIYLRGSEEIVCLDLASEND